MSDAPITDDPKVREALEELQSYLSDSIPPLFFADSVKILFQVPPNVVAAQIIAWSMGQIAPGGPLPTADYIFHAAKKIHMLSELELLPSEAGKRLSGQPDSSPFGWMPGGRSTQPCRRPWSPGSGSHHGSSGWRCRCGLHAPQ